MTSPPRPSPPEQASLRLAVAGAGSLAGKELVQLLAGAFPGAGLRLLDAEEVAGTLTQAGDEPAFIQQATAESFAGARVVFLAGSRDFAARHWGAARKAGATVIDLTGALAQVPAAIPWIPALDGLLPPPRPPVGHLFWLPGAPAVIGVSLAAALVAHGLRRAAITFLRPVADRGQEAIDELERQTVSLLSFQPVAGEVFDAQVAFNFLARYGEGSAERLGDVRAAVAREIAAYLAGRAPVPAVQMIQAPVFYGLTFSAYLETDAPRQQQQLEAALAAAGVLISAATDPAPDNIGAAGQAAVSARLEPDAQVSGGWWLWGAADHLRLSAGAAVAAARRLLEAQGRE